MREPASSASAAADSTAASSAREKDAAGAGMPATPTPTARSGGSGGGGGFRTGGRGGLFAAAAAAAAAAGAEEEDADDRAARESAASLAMAREALLKRQRRAQYFDEALALGPQVFTDTAPSLLNMLLVVLVGNVASYLPSSLECKTDALRLYMNGLIGLAYALLAVLCLFALRKQVITHVRVPFTLCAAWAGATLAFAFVGALALRDGKAHGCDVVSPWLFWFAAFETATSGALAALLLAKWFSAAAARSFAQCTRSIVERRAQARAKR